MINLPNDLASRNMASAANRLPDHISLMLAAGVIQRKYNVSPGIAQIVAEIVGASIEVRQ
jgi:hypothetical protein